jgi:hypothetical protein
MIEKVPVCPLPPGKTLLTKVQDTGPARIVLVIVVIALALGVA